MSSTIVCDLPTEIHPILARENWIYEHFDENTALWNDLQPALRLVTQMLIHDRLLMWYTHAMFGQLSNIGSDHPSGIGKYLEQASGSWDPGALGTVRRILHVLEIFFMICFL